MVAKWEIIWNNSCANETYRMQVPGGWLVRHYLNNSSCMSFVPDPNHQWIIQEKTKTDGELLEEEIVKATLKGSDVYKEQLKDSAKNSCM